jgi:hypothetical protein
MEEFDSWSQGDKASGEEGSLPEVRGLEGRLWI